ncbi:MAG: hypothetical protein KC619_07350 [Myxococcales bacterium]|nr:hypothetical protein [Myxococcales bacterium]
MSGTRSAALLIALALGCGGDPTPEPPAEVDALETRTPVPAPETPEQAEETEVADEVEPPIATVPGTVRLVPIHAHALLRSETRALAGIEQALEAEGLDPELATPDEEETRVATALLDGGSADALPAPWRDRQAVFVVRITAPSVRRDGRRVAGGFEDLLVLRPPSNKPFFSADADPQAPFGAVSGAWLADLLAGAGVEAPR